MAVEARFCDIPCAFLSSLRQVNYCVEFLELRTIFVRALVPRQSKQPSLFIRAIRLVYVCDQSTEYQIWVCLFVCREVEKKEWNPLLCLFFYIKVSAAAQTRDIDSMEGRATLLPLEANAFSQKKVEMRVRRLFYLYIFVIFVFLLIIFF